MTWRSLAMAPTTILMSPPSPITSLRLKGLSTASSSNKPQCMVAAATGSFPSLSDLPLIYCPTNAKTHSSEDPANSTFIFAIYDHNFDVQYMGFSRDVRSSLETLMAHSTEHCHYYKAYNLSDSDQKNMLAIKQQWMAEIESTRKLKDGTSKIGAEKDFLKERECSSSDEQEDSKIPVNNLREVSGCEQAYRARNIVVRVPRGKTIAYKISYEGKFPTSIGWMYEIVVTKDSKDTRHRIICEGKYVQAVNMNEDRFVEIVMAFLLHKNVARPEATNRWSFPIDFFAVGEVHKRFNDFNSWFNEKLPELDYLKPLKPN